MQNIVEAAAAPFVGQVAQQAAQSMIPAIQPVSDHVQTARDVQYLRSPSDARPSTGTKLLFVAGGAVLAAFLLKALSK
jgi:hypothetical protein